MSKIRTVDQAAPEHTQSTEFRNKVEANAKAAQVHGEALRHSYESATAETPGQAENSDQSRPGATTASEDGDSGN